MRAGMRREDDVRQILERRIDERLLLKGVQTQTAKLAGADGLGCGCFVDQTAALMTIAPSCISAIRAASIM